jgi:hypothetical protein
VKNLFSQCSKHEVLPLAAFFNIFAAVSALSMTMHPDQLTEITTVIALTFSFAI